MLGLQAVLGPRDVLVHLELQERLDWVVLLEVLGLQEAQEAQEVLVHLVLLDLLALQEVLVLLEVLDLQEAQEVLVHQEVLVLQEVQDRLDKMVFLVGRLLNMILKIHRLQELQVILVLVELK